MTIEQAGNDADAANGLLVLMPIPFYGFFTPFFLPCGNWAMAQG